MNLSARTCLIGHPPHSPRGGGGAMLASQHGSVLGAFEATVGCERAGVFVSEFASCLVFVEAQSPWIRAALPSLFQPGSLSLPAAGNTGE